MGSSAGSIPAGTVLLAALFALVAVKYFFYRLLEVPSAGELSAKEDICMSRLTVMLASAVETLHGLGVSGLAGCLLTKESLTPND